MKIFVVLALAISILAYPVCERGIAQAAGREAGAFNFSDVYKKPWYKREGFIYGAVFGAAALVAVGTYLTAGTATAASAGPVATYIGTLIGSLGGLSGIAATNAGLAMLGGGAVASGGLGVLGGVALLNGVGDLALSMALIKAEKYYPSDAVEGGVVVALPVPELLGGEQVRKHATAINRIKEGGADVDSVILLQAMHALAENENGILSSSDALESAANTLVSAICNFNLGNYGKAKQLLDEAASSADPAKSSFIKYFSGLIALTDGDVSLAIERFKESSAQEQDVTPMLAAAKSHIQNGNFEAAISDLETARRDIDSENYAVNNTLAAMYFRAGRYEDAKEMYREALSNVSINEFEAECKMFIAICYFKMKNYQESQKWVSDSMSELDDKNIFKDSISKIFKQEVQEH